MDASQDGVAVDVDGQQQRRLGRRLRRLCKDDGRGGGVEVILVEVHLGTSADEPVHQRAQQVLPPGNMADENGALGVGAKPMFAVDAGNLESAFVVTIDR